MSTKRARLTLASAGAAVLLISIFYLVAGDYPGERRNSSLQDSSNQSLHLQRDLKKKNQSSPELITFAVPLSEEKGKKSPLGGCFGRANYFAFVSLYGSQKEVTSLAIRENPHREMSEEAGVATSQFISEQGADLLITTKIGEKSLDELGKSDIAVYKVAGGDLGQAIADYLAGRWTRLDANSS